MSRETYQWLADNVLAGFQAEQYNRPVWWHRIAEKQGHTLRTWPDAIPFEVVHEHLAGWEPTTSKLFDADMHEVKSHQLVRTPDGEAVIGIDHKLHRFGTWLTGTVRECVGDEAQISSAGLLREKMQAWVTIERPQSAIGPAGIRFSPFITLSTSLDGSMKTQINQNTQLPICDNTLSVARGEGLSFKHTKNSESKLGTYREVMTSLMQGETDFRKVLESLVTTDVSTRQAAKVLDRLYPVDDSIKPRQKARHSRIRQEIHTLYTKDSRVTQWTGTAFGLLQALNTWDQHMSQLCNKTGFEMTDTDLRAMRNYGDRMRQEKGKSQDEKYMSLINEVTDSGHKTMVAV